MITAHAVSDTGNVGKLYFGTSGKCLNWETEHQSFLSVYLFLLKLSKANLTQSRSVATVEKSNSIPPDTQ